MKRLQGFIAGFIAALMLTGIFALAKNMYEKIDVLYNDIKIKIDGEEFVPTDVNGNFVEPFIYNGTTYLPVRAIATALDMNVGWDETTYTVSLDTKIENADEAEPEISAPEIPDDDVDISGKWECDLSYVLKNMGVPETALTDNKIVIVYEYADDGTYKTHVPEECVNNLINISFEYALYTYGMTEAEYIMISGVSVEETKAQIAKQLNAEDFAEEGTYSLKGGILYSTADGKEQVPAKYTLDGDTLTLDDGELVLVFVKVK